MTKKEMELKLAQLEFEIDTLRDQLLALSLRVPLHITYLPSPPLPPAPPPISPWFPSTPYAGDVPWSGAGTATVAPLTYYGKSNKGIQL